ncbi:hypothetical protein ES703_123659 [subsurface metagenome]
MAKRKRKRKHIPRPRSYYGLSEVIRKINNGQFIIRPNATQHALEDFGWGISEIKKAYNILKAKHFYKTDASKINPLWVVDIYKARLIGEDIYTHFYIDDTVGILVINSFKRDQ